MPTKDMKVEEAFQAAFSDLVEEPSKERIAEAKANPLDSSLTHPDVITKATSLMVLKTVNEAMAFLHDSVKAYHPAAQAIIRLMYRSEFEVSADDPELEIKLAKIAREEIDTLVSIIQEDARKHQAKDKNKKEN